MGGMVDVAELGASVDARRSLDRVDAHAAHPRQIDDQTIVDRAESGSAVTAAPNGDRETLVTSDVDRGDHIAGVHRASDEQRALVDHAVLDASRLIVGWVVRADEVAAKPAL